VAVLEIPVNERRGLRMGRTERELLDWSCAWRLWWLFREKRPLIGSRVKKGIWWMPWRQEAMKDVARCDKLRGGASIL
jgi:hypothetical protein